MPQLDYNREEEEERLEGFLLNMTDEQALFIEQSQGKSYKLDRIYSLNSLTELERYVREQKVDFGNPSNEALDQRTNCWYYLGEVVRRNFNGQWAFSMNEENTIHWGAYVVTGHCSVPGVEFEPLGLLKRFILRGYPTGALQRAIKSQVVPAPVDFSDLPDEA